MQEHEYKARDKTVRKMNRDGLTEENLQTGETVRVSQREREERILPKQAEDVPFSRSSRNPDDLTERKKPRKKPKDSLEEEQGEMIPSSVSDGGGVSSSKDFVWPSDSLIAEHWTEKPEMGPDGEPETASSRRGDGRMECFLAIDIGASSGRHIVGTKENGRLCLKEVYRFENGMKRDNKDASLYWDVDELYGEILNGMKACKEAGFEPKSMGIDTWGVDFVLLDEAGERIGNAIAYRDKRTEQMDKIVYETVQEQELYLRTGTQKQQFNTIYQLMALKERHPQVLEKAETFLMIPDYFHFLLTGEIGNEYTNATTTQLINPETKDWDWELIRMLGYPEKIFQKIRRPGTVLGKLKEEVAEKVGFSCDVILPATHDTGSAIMAIPSTEENVMYISSGTWSLMGSECLKPICTEQSRNLNFTNEGGYDYRFRFLKNIMGLWMIQSIRREQQKTYSFAEICGMAEKCKMFPSRVDVNSPVFLAPESMTEAVKAECRKTGQTVPESLGELAAVVYESLAVCYGKTAAEIGKLTGKKYDVLHVIGGGANADYLNQITADYTGKIIVAGPGEATALGNILAQMLQAGVFKDLQEARGAVALSFPLRKFYPKGV